MNNLPQQQFDAEFRRFWLNLGVKDHCVYRLYDAENNFLYVGITVQLRPRIRNHCRTSEWAKDIHRVEIEYGFNKGKALQREREIILAEDPLHNRTRYSPKNADTWLY